MKPTSISVRLYYALGTLLCVGALAFALYLQIADHVLPCPLCILQRVATITAGIVFIVATVVNPRQWGRRVVGLFAVMAAGFGFAVALRQVWLQYIAAHSPGATCGPGLDYLLKALPWQQALSMVFQGSGDCAAITWTFLGLSLAAWSVALFAILLTIGLIVLCKPSAKRPA